MVAHLLTEKGSTYIAGVIKLNPQQISGLEGQIINLKLYKCIDTSACCDIKINKVFTFQSPKKRLSKSIRTIYNPSQKSDYIE